MPSPPRRICQFAPAVAPGDGVTNSAFYIRRLLDGMDVHNRIYSHRPPFELRQQVADMHLFREADWDLIMIHHSMGHDLDRWIEGIAIPAVLLYHNITPERYFSPDSGDYFFAIKGRQQLKAWADLFTAAVGMSGLNSKELVEYGYSHVRTIPLLIDPTRCLPTGGVPETGYPDRFLLGVGRMARNKRQDLMIDGLAALNALLPEGEEYHLVLVGDTGDRVYMGELEALVGSLDLADLVHFTGKIPDHTLGRLYRQAAALWCTSEHEGFCMPLVEACTHRLPVVALDNAAVTDTLGTAGLILDSASPLELAAATRQVLTDPALCTGVIEQGLKNSERYSEAVVGPRLRELLCDINTASAV